MYVNLTTGNKAPRSPAAQTDNKDGEAAEREIGVLAVWVVAGP